ncbi:putative plasmid maintenance toxin/cell growth inhibitor [Leptolyngbya sp. NIES-3755]|nr:putative plasmid maintenance toxin/cell growth inhibitor [Leptolyngbya sp. NIES-3755]
MPKPKIGEIWLVNFPFTDLTATKLRPAFVVAPYHQDVIILGIFSKIPSGTIADRWVLIEDNYAQFQQTGLKKSSVLRTEKIATVHESIFHKKLGTLPPDLAQQVEITLKKTLKLSE